MSEIRRIDFSSFDVLSEIRRGGQGTLYKVRNKQYGGVYALKACVISTRIKEVILNSEVSVIKEISLAPFVDCPGLVEYYDVFTFSDQKINSGSISVGLLMEYVDGKDFFDLEIVKNIPKITSLFFEIIKTIDFLHKHGVVHRDIKMENMMLASDGSVKLVDFGFATLIDQCDLFQRLGTPNYSPPEVHGRRLKRELLTKIDIWSFGLTIYGCLFECFPWTSDNYYDISREVESGVIRKLLENHQFPNPMLEKVVKGCLQMKPENRPTAEQIISMWKSV